MHFQICQLNSGMTENTKNIGHLIYEISGVWHHGDFAEKADNNSFIIYGRSDATA